MRNAFLYVLLLTIIACSTSKLPQVEPVQATIEKSVESIDPIMLDDIHYYTLDREACNLFFEQNFFTKAMLEESENPFEFIDFQLLTVGQSTINISKQGPFPGIRAGDPKRWERKLITPSPDNAPRYGVHWLALETNDLSKSVRALQANGVEIADYDFELPHSNAKSILCYGPDYNLIVVTENKSDQFQGYRINHLLLLVDNMTENVNFYKEVFQGKVISKTKHYIMMDIANHQFILANPEALGIGRSHVEKRDLTIFRPDIDHLGFLYKDVHPAYDHAIKKGYSFLSKPVPISYFGRATLYTFAITYSPDGLQCEMYQEVGRTVSRRKTKN